MLKGISTKKASCDFKTFIKVSLFLCCLNFSFSYAFNHNSEYPGYDDSENEYAELGLPNRSAVNFALNTVALFPLPLSSLALPLNG